MWNLDKYVGLRSLHSVMSMFKLYGMCIVSIAFFSIFGVVFFYFINP